VSKIATIVEKHIVTGVCKRLIFAVLHPTRELIGSHVTRENRIYALEVLQHASSSEDTLDSSFAAALHNFDFTAPYCLLLPAKLLILVSDQLYFLKTTNTHECLEMHG
jgi:hypothetical protein